MDKLTELHKSLYVCYRKIHYRDFFKLSEDDRSKLCVSEKQLFLDHLNSDVMEAEHIIKKVVDEKVKRRDDVASLNNIKI